MPVRRSIWDFNDHYAIPPKVAKSLDFEMIAKLQSIEAAKKNTPPAPIAALNNLGRCLVKHPSPVKVTPQDFEKYLGDLLIYGVGIKTAVCMLAVISKGTYPPMDKQVADGLRRLRIINHHDEAALNGTKLSRFSMVYVRKVLPEWRRRRLQGTSPRDLDNEWMGVGRKS